MNRKATISQHIEVLEALRGNDSERFAGWELTFLKMCRREFDLHDDLKESQFETLEKLRARLDPPALGKANTPIPGTAVTSGVGSSPVSQKDPTTKFAKTNPLSPEKVAAYFHTEDGQHYLKQMKNSSPEAYETILKVYGVAIKEPVFDPDKFIASRERDVLQDVLAEISTRVSGTKDVPWKGHTIQISWRHTGAQPVPGKPEVPCGGKTGAQMAAEDQLVTHVEHKGWKRRIQQPYTGGGFYFCWQGRMCMAPSILDLHNLFCKEVEAYEVDKR